MNLSNFFQAIGMIASQQIDPFLLNSLDTLDWLEASAAYLAWMEAHQEWEG